MTYDEQLLDLRKKHVSIKEIAAIVGKSERTVSRDFKRLGLTKPADRTDILDSEVLALWESGLTIIEIANRFGCSHDTITKRLSAQGVLCDRASGIRRHFARTHGDLWPEIKSDLDNGLSPSVLAGKYHMRYENIFRLMELNDYQYVAGKPFHLDGWDKRMAAVDGKNGRWANTEREYLLAIRSYCEAYGSLPTARVLSEEMGKAYSSVIAIVKSHDLYDFIDNTMSCGALQRLTADLNRLGVRYELNNRRILGGGLNKKSGLEIDVWLKDFNIGVEVNPTGTHTVDDSHGVSDVLYHQRKSLLAEDAGVGLIHMYDEDFMDFRKYQVFLGRIEHLVKPAVRAGARACDVRAIEFVECARFLDLYHFQGSEHGSSVRFGLYLMDVLVAVLCIGSPRFTDHEFEIIRYCVRPGYMIAGCFGKLFKTFLDSLSGPAKIVSYMDLNKRFSAGNVYDRNGFVLDGITRPDYWWAKKYGAPILKRYETTKAKLIEQGFDGNLTEVEIMRSRGYFRVFGAGSKRYVYKYLCTEK